MLCVTEAGIGDILRLMLYRALYILLTGLTGRDSPLTISLWVLFVFRVQVLALGPVL